MARRFSTGSVFLFLVRFFVLTSKLSISAKIEDPAARKCNGSMEHCSDSPYGTDAAVSMDATILNTRRIMRRTWRVRNRFFTRRPRKRFGTHNNAIKSEESRECALPRPMTPCYLRDGERIHVAFVSAMWHREPITESETRQMITSVLAQTRCKLWIHFLVAGLPETRVIPEMMEALGGFQIVPSPSSVIWPAGDPWDEHPPYVNTTYPQDAAVLFSLHSIPAQWVEEQAKKLQLFPLTHHASIPGMCKFFIADILWQVEQVILLDVDMIIGGDIQNLWSFKNAFKDSEPLMFYMSSDNPEGRGPRSRYRPWCSCQMVLDLDKMRERDPTKLVLAALKGRSPRDLKSFVDDGDQWLFTWLCKNFRRFCRVLPRMWNVSGCSRPDPFLGLTGRGKQLNSTCWRMVHFNCLAHSSLNGSYDIPEGWVEPVTWIQSLQPRDLKQADDWRVWNGF